MEYAISIGPVGEITFLADGPVIQHLPISPSGDIVIDSTAITGGVSGRLLYNKAGTVGETDTLTYASGLLTLGTPQTSINQTFQVTAPFSNINASQDVLRVQLGSLDPGIELSGGSFSNWAVVGVAGIPAGVFTGLTGWPSGGVAGYAVSANSSISPVAVYGNGGMTVNGASAYGGNFSVINGPLFGSTSDNGFNFNVLYAVEADVNIQATPGNLAPTGSAAAFIADLNVEVTNTGFLTAFLVATINAPWKTGFATGAGTAIQGLSLSSQLATGPSDSQFLDVTAQDSMSNPLLGRVMMDSDTNFKIINAALGNQFYLSNPAIYGVSWLAYHQRSGNPAILKVWNDTINATTVAEFVLQTGTTDSYATNFVQDGSSYVLQSGVGLVNGISIQPGAGGLDITSFVASESYFWAEANVVVPSGGTAGAGYKFFSTTNFGMFGGTGAPTLSAQKGSLYLDESGGVPYYNNDGSTGWTSMGGGSGTVTVVSVVSANGFAGTVATDTTTPAITLTTTITGILQGNGTAISAASTTGTGSTVVLSAAPTLSGNPVLGGSPSSTSYVLASAGDLIWNGRTYIESAADGDLTLNNTGTTGFGKIQLGGKTSSFPAIKRSGAGIAIRVADDTADGALTALSFNGLTISTSTGTLTIANGKVATISNTLTFTGTDSSSVAFGAGGTVLYANQSITLSGDVTGTGATAITTVVAKIAGTTVSGTTGSTNVVFSASPTLTGTITAAAANFSDAVAITSASANSFAVGRQGTTTPSFSVDSSTGSQTGGLKVTGSALNGTVAVVVTDTSGNTNLTINALGTGTIGIGSVSTGRVTITPVTTITGALTLSAVGLIYNGVTLTGTTGTGNMVLSAGPTFTGTITAAAADFTGNMSFTGVLVQKTGVFMNYIAGAGSTNAFTATYSPAITAYLKGQIFFVQINNTQNNTTPTLNVNGLGAKTIVKRASTAVASGDMVNGGIYIFAYDGTNFQVLNPTVN